MAYANRPVAWEDQLLTLRTPPHTREPDDINQEQFDRLLDWLDPNREVAGVKYEWIRKRLIKTFACRGSNVPEELADKTINRVARKLPEIHATYVGEPAHYFYGVASNIIREALRKDRSAAVAAAQPSSPDDDKERDYAFLEKCMNELPADDRKLIVAYYQQEKRAKIDHRKKLAEKLGLGMNALRIRACRIRASLLESMELYRSEAT